MSVGIGQHGSASLSFSRPMRWRAGVMTVLAGLFLLRVVGQALVTFAEIERLPAVEHSPDSQINGPKNGGRSPGLPGLTVAADFGCSAHTAHIL